MSSDKGKIADAGTGDWLDTTVIDFLDKEIAASSISGTNRELEDLDATLTNLMQEVLLASDLESQPDTKAAEVDQMLSGILVNPQELPSLEVIETAEDSPDVAAEDSLTAVPILAESTEANTPVPIFLPIQNLDRSQPESVVPPPLVFTTHHKARPMMPGLLIAAALALLAGGVGLVLRVGGTKVARSDSVSISQPSAPSTESQASPARAFAAPAAAPSAMAKATDVQARSMEAPAPRLPTPAKVPATPTAAAADPKVSAIREIPSNIAQSAELNLPAKPAPGVASLSLSPDLSRDLTEKPANLLAESPRVPAADASAGGDAAAAKFLESPAKPESSDPSPVAPLRVAPPELISRVLPVYPEAVRRMHLSGTVVLDLQIDASGKVVKAVPVSGMPVFSAAAVNAVLQWRYKPASSNGRNVPSQSRVSVIFK